MKKEIMKAIKAELNYDELDALYSLLYEKDFEAEGNFYHPDIFIDVCMKKLRNEIDDEYFRLWLILLCNLMNRDENHSDLGDKFDAYAFDDCYDALKCRLIISEVKAYDLRFKHPNIVEHHKRKKMKVRYLRFEYCNSENNSIYKCYIIDHGKKTYDLRMVDESELDYDLSKNYCYMYDEEHEADIKRQEDDESIECIDMSKPEKQFCEIEDELITLIHDKYKRDKSLEL